MRLYVVDRSVHPYCAPSIETYLGWNVAKRRACEVSDLGLYIYFQVFMNLQAKLKHPHSVNLSNGLSFIFFNTQSRSQNEQWFCVHYV